MTPLKPQNCPVCGGEDCVEIFEMFGWNKFSVRCTECGLVGPLVKQKSEAIAVWNRLRMEEEEC